MDKKLSKWHLGKQMLSIFLFAMMMVVATISSVQTVDAAPNIIRHEGERRENVAENVAKTHFGDSNKIILVNREKFPDAISATNISQGRYPVLYTHKGHVSESTLNLIQSMALDEIYLLGGELSINTAVVNQLKNATGVKVTRIDGKNRYVANVNAISTHFNQKNHVVIASGQVYADALYGVSYANTIDAPIVLTRKNYLDLETIELLRDLNASHATIIGGPATVTSAVEDQLSQLRMTHDRIAGQNRYAGSAEVALASYTNLENLVVASGEVFPDALVSAPLAQKLNAPILLVRSNQINSIVKSYIKNSLPMINNIYIQGGPQTIAPSLLDEILPQEPDKPTDDRLDVAFNLSLFNQEVLALVNEERARVGVQPLDYEQDLQHGVDTRTLDSISIQTLNNDHSRPDGSPWYTAFNYLNGTSVFASGENLAYNWLTYEKYEELSQTSGALEAELAQIFYDQYANSPGHYENMIRDSFNGMAVSTMFANHDNSQHYMRAYNTMVFSYSY